MIRRTRGQYAATTHMGHRRLTRMWPEDEVNDYSAKTYYSFDQALRWYELVDRRNLHLAINRRQMIQTENHHNGLHVTGAGAFERELERKGIQVEKYELPTTVGVRRIHEMVLARRRELETRSAALMAAQRKKLRQAKPSEWYEERGGPLNVHFLRFAQSSYDENITKLPQNPIT